MPPRGHHGYEHAAANTGSRGQYQPSRGGSGGVGSWGGGLGIKPDTIDNFFAGGAHAGQFRDAWTRPGGGRDTVLAEQMAKQHEWDQKKLWYQAAAKDLASKYISRARTLSQAAKGANKAEHQRIAEYYGLDLKSRAGRKAAEGLARRLQEVAIQSSQVDSHGTPTGAANLIAFDTGIKKAVATNRHKALVAQQKALEAQAHPDTVDTILGVGGKALEVITQPLQRAYYASKYSQLHGGDLLDQVRAFGGGLPGLGFTAGHGDIRKAIERTNTQAEREALTKRGELLSFGQALTEQYGKLSPDARHLAEQSSLAHGLGMDNIVTQSYQRAVNDAATSKGGTNFLSGTIDATFLVATDPTMYIGKVLEAGRAVGFALNKTLEETAIKAAAKEGVELSAEQLGKVVTAGRAQFIERSVIGRAVMEQTLRAVERYGASDVSKIVKVLGKDTGRELANSVAEAGLKGGSDAVREVLTDAFAKGAWVPERSILQRASLTAAELSGGALSLPKVSIGKLAPITAFIADHAGIQKFGKAAKTAGTAALEGRGIAKGAKALTAVSRANTVDEALEYSVRHIAIHNKKFAGDLVDRFAGDAVTNLDERAAALLDMADQSISPGFKHVVAEITRPLKSNAVEGLTPEVQAVLAERIRYAEAVAAALRGEAGADARKAVLDQLDRQTALRSVDSRASSIVARIVKDRELGVEFTPDAWRSIDPVDVRVHLENNVPEGELKEHLKEELAAAKPGSRRYGVIAATVDLAADSKSVFDEATRALELFGARADMEAVLRDVVLDTNGTLIGKASQSLLSLSDKAPGNVLRTLASPFVGENERAIADFMNRWVGAVGATRAEREFLATEAERMAKTIAQGGAGQAAVSFHRSIVELAFSKFGLDKDVADAWIRKDAERLTGQANDQAYGLVLKEGVDPTGKLTDADWELLDRPAVNAQAQTVFRTVDVERMMEGIRHELAQNDSSSIFNNIHVVFDKSKNITLIKTKGGRELTIRGGLRAAHRFWKVMVTTRLYLGPLAFGAALATGQDPWQAIAFGLVGSGAGLVRYRARLSIQNRLDAVLYHGFTPEEWVPGLGRWLKHNERDIYGGATSAIYNDPDALSWVEARVGNIVRGKTGDWKVVTAAGGGKNGFRDFVEAYHRILNFQVNPESDEVMRLFLNHKAGRITKDELDGALERFFKGEGEYEGTGDGAAWLQKARSIGLKNKKKAIDSYGRFVDHYLPNEEVAAMRLDTMGPGQHIAHDVIEQLAGDGKLAQAAHFFDAENVFKESGLLGGIGRSFKKMWDSAAYDQASSTSFRETFFANEHKRAEELFLSRGVAPEEARNLAGELATRRTNELMFRYDNVSRFAHKADWIAPFTGHRLYNATTWTKLAVEHTGRVLRIGWHAARAFNVGKQQGFFHQDPYGAWQMTIPGSSALSRALGGPTEVNFDMSLTGFLAVGSELTRASSTYDFTEVGGAVGGITDVVAPHPGGVWWAGAGAAIREVAPELLDPEKSPLPASLRDFLYPYGGQAALLAPEAARMLRVMVGTSGPWAALDDETGIEEVNRWEVRVAQDLISEHRKQYPQDLNWFPSDDEVKSRTMALFETWNMLLTLSPASPHPVFHNKQKFEELWTAFIGGPAGETLLKQDSKQYFAARNAFVERYPAFAPFLDKTTKWVDNSDAGWVDSGHGINFDTEEGQVKYQLQEFQKRRRQQSLSDYREQFRQLRKDGEARDAFHNALNAPTSYEKYEALRKYRQDFPEQARRFATKNTAKEELAHILSMPARAQAKALHDWRLAYAKVEGPRAQSVKRTTYDRWVTEIRKNERTNGGRYLLSPWKRARNGEDLWKQYSRSVDGAVSIMRRDGTLNHRMLAYVNGLENPAEQLQFWNEATYQLAHNATFLKAHPEDAVNVYNRIKRHIGQVWNAHGDELRRSSTPNEQDAPKDTAYADSVKEWQTKNRNTLGVLYAELDKKQAAMQAAFDGKRWKEAYAIKDAIERDDPKNPGLYKQIQMVKDEAFNNHPASKEMHDAIREVAYLTDIHAPKTAVAEALWKVRRASAHPFVPTDEEAHVLSMPASVRQAYINDLTARLGLPEGKDFSKQRFALNTAQAWAVDAEGVGGNPNSIESKMYWSYLTDFQKQLLEKNLPSKMVDTFKGVDTATAKERSDGAGKKGFGRSGGGSEVSWAYAQMKKYSQRGGMAKPKDYDAYLQLPNNPAVRHDFLDKHPDVAEYVKRGPMANMPPVIQMMVQDIMIRNGKWQGEPRDIGELTDIAFAREQLQRYNKRTGPAPATYDEWLAMPTGQAKADYLTAHPEIKAWLQLGPMANMPEMYRDVVRDIMYRYHEWTTTTDGMGQVISDYYRTPSYARSQYLSQHPELAAYWQALRSPEEDAIGSLVDAYYSTPDPGAKAAMLSTHPELKQYFVDSRTRRYERFLNQVAQYMGQNPELFQSYLDRQTQVMSDLLNKFAEPNLAAETHWLRPTKPTTKSSEGGRKRAA